MSQTSVSARRVSRTELLARVEALAPLIESTASQSEARGSLVPEVVDAFQRTGLFRLWSASEVGGYDISVSDQLEILMAIARLDMSAGWTVMIGASTSAVMASRLPDEGVAALFGGTRWPTVASSLKASGLARRAEGGYRVSGRWGFGSGIRHGVGAMAHCMVEAPSKGGPHQIGAFVPLEQIEILDDWQVAGLRGTGSNSYLIDDVFVPDHFVGVMEPMTVHRGGPAAANLLRRLAIEHGAIALGGARRVLDEVCRQAGDKRRLSETRTVAENTHFQVELGRMEAEFLALVAGARDVAREFDRALGVGEDEIAAAAVALRAVCAHATEASAAIVAHCLRHAGAGAIMPGQPIERFQRDMTVAAQHYMVGDNAYEALAVHRMQRKAQSPDR